MTTREPVGDVPSHRHLVLIGLMGAGKTTVGLECARRLGRAFVDTDDLVTGRARMSVDEIFVTGGEGRFRQVERDVVADVCASPEPLVVACGGGTVLDPENRRALRAAGIVIWLRAPAHVLAGRVGDGTTRPLLRDDPAGSLVRLERLREPVYESAAHVQIDTDGLSVDAVAGAVLAAFAGDVSGRREAGIPPSSAESGPARSADSGKSV